MHTEHPPAPEDIVKLIARILELPWPASVAERREFFDALGLRASDAIAERHERDPRTTRGWLSFDASDRDIVWIAFDDKLVGVTIFAVHSSDARDPAARRSYDDLVTRLSETLGESAAIDDGSACLEWRLGESKVDITLYDSRDSMVSIGITHVANGDAYETHARERTRNDPTSLAHPRRVLHLAHRADWDASRESGEYHVSTWGRTLEDVGFIHGSNLEQLVAVAGLFYADDPEPLVILALDDRAIRDSGVEIRYEDGGNGQLYPHIYGPILREFVTDVYPARMERGRLVFPG